MRGGGRRAGITEIRWATDPKIIRPYGSTANCYFKRCVREAAKKVLLLMAGTLSTRITFFAAPLRRRKNNYFDNKQTQNQRKNAEQIFLSVKYSKNIF